MRRCACRHGQARACMHAAACARVRCRVRDGFRRSLPFLPTLLAISSSDSDQSPAVASHPACALSRPLAQETAKHDQVTRTTCKHACTACQGARTHADACSRLLDSSFASHVLAAYVRSAPSHTLLPHTTNSLIRASVTRNPKP